MRIPEDLGAHSRTRPGKIFTERLKSLDNAAYVRFASVYLDFKDIRAFMNELKDLLKTK